MLRDELCRRGFQVLRIKEKWQGAKLHHGDLYVSRDGNEWFVIESKGLKSNSERWHKLGQIDPSSGGVERWMNRKRRGEIGRWWAALPPEHRERLLTLGTFPRAKILETHLVSGTAGRAGRIIATPKRSEFHVLAVDLFLRTHRHEFVFASSARLESPPKHPDHLKQNYIIDILVPGFDTIPTLPAPWTLDFESLFRTLTNPVKRNEMQVDERRPGEREAEEEESDETG